MFWLPLFVIIGTILDDFETKPLGHLLTDIILQ
uniref:Uncharacterized protein n=1 Tax=Tetranychus urticae TaxID=32264 RepID=T1KFM4_TETUR